MKALVLFLSTFAFAAGVHAAPPAKGDAKAGKALHEKSCVNRHVSLAAASTRAPTARCARRSSSRGALPAATPTPARAGSPRTKPTSRRI